MTAAASATRRRNGVMIPVICVVNSSFPGTCPKPGAIQGTRRSAKRMPSRQITETVTRRKLMTRLASRIAASGPCRSWTCVRVGTNAALIAPSAKRSRSRFGIRKATWKASTANPAPKKAAKICSRMRPRTRLNRVASETMPAALASPVSLPGAPLGTAATAAWLGGTGKGTSAATSSGGSGGGSRFSVTRPHPQGTLRACQAQGGVRRAMAERHVRPNPNRAKRSVFCYT